MDLIIRRKASKMKFRGESGVPLWIFVCFAIFYFANDVTAITDPRDFATKPPIHRESALPWYLNDGDPTPPVELSGLEQQLDTKNSGHRKTINFNQKTRPGSDQSFGSYTGKSSYGNSQNKNLRYENKNNLYEDVSVNSKKPTLVLLPPSEPINTIAKYDEKSGAVECPDPKATGLFVYPPDCKYFVNCHRGQAEVQACAPGTLFCAKSLECDFPSKATCYSSERVARNSYQQSRGSPDSHNAQLNSNVPKEPTRAPCFSGLVAHPDNCYKYLQCDHGGTFIRDCGPGTAFNPEISACDWPYKVPACSKKPTSTNSNIPASNNPQGGYGGRPNPHGNPNSGDRDGRYGWQGRPEVPPGGGGRYPNGHSNGPYNENIRENYPERPYHNGEGIIEPRVGPDDWDLPASSLSGSQDRYGSSGSSRGHTDHYGNQEQGFPSYPDQDNSQTVVTPWNSNGYVSSRPNAHQPVQGPNGPNGPKQFDQNHDRWNSGSHNSGTDEYVAEASHHQVNGHAHDGTGSWDPSGNQYPDDGLSQTPTRPWGHPGFQNPPNGQGTSQPASGQWGHSGYQNSRNNGEDYSQTPSRNWGQAGFQPPRNEEDGLTQTSTGNWEHSGFQHSGNGEEGLSQTSSNGPGDSWTPNDYHHRHGNHNGHHHPHHDHRQHPHGHGHNHEDGNWHGPKQETPNYGYPENDRTGYGRTNPDFPINRPEGPNPPNRIPQSGRRPEQSFPTRPNWNPQPGYGRPEMRPSQPETTNPQSGVFIPSSFGTPNWNDRGGSIPMPNRPTQQPTQWNQANNSGDKRMDDWQSKTNILQRGDKQWDQDRKMDEWSSKTNIYGAQQGNRQQVPGAKTPINSGIYVDINGTRGHYITKEIEVNQGHSNTRNYGQKTTETPQISNVPNRANGTQPRWRPLRYKTVNETSSEKTPNSGNKKKPPTHWTPMRYKPQNETKPSNENQNNNYPNKNYEPITTEGPNFGESFPGQEDDLKGPGIELPTVQIEEDYHREKEFKRRRGKEDETIEFSDIVEPNTDNYDIEVLEKDSWKPRVEFPKKKSDESNIMKINKKEPNLEILDVKLEPWFKDEPPFPTYYVAPVHPLGYVREPKIMTPTTGQVIRLRGGSSPENGYLEVQGEHPGWGIVCDSWNGWSLKEAHVVCRQLGYTRGAEMAWQGRIEQSNDEIPWIAATKVDCKGNETQFQTCKFVHGDECNVKRDAVGIRCMPNRIAYCRDDEIAHEGRCYHVANPDTALNHAEALDYCLSRKAHLVDITSQAENNFLSEWLMQKHPHVKSVMTSGVGFTTRNKTLWIWEDSSQAKYQFSKWWPGWTNEKTFPPTTGLRPVCIVLKKHFPCYNKPDENCTADYFFWDAEDCAASMKGHSYICERFYDDIGCVYGKGQTYAGKANITNTGKKCLNWNDPSLSYSLDIMAVNSEHRKELTHNYCRNPNPSRDLRPWCFITSSGERESCDIPPCGATVIQKTPAGGKCKPKHFECRPGECIPSPWVCDGEEDCTNGLDEAMCSSHLNFFKKTGNRRLKNHDIEEWKNTPVKTCALRCKEADFKCHSFSHNSKENICFLSDANIGLTGDLIFDADYDYYEMIDRSINCENMFVCQNGKCVNRTEMCDGKNNCGDRSDENICSVEKLDYAIRLVGSNNSNEGRVEVKVRGVWGQICDDGFGQQEANIICSELGFNFGALKFGLEGYFGNMDPPDRFMVDQLKCRGNESSLRECDFDGWGVHNCHPGEAVGIVCKTAVNACPLDHWKCDKSPECIALPYICDSVSDCKDSSDESSDHCGAPFQIRLVNGSNPREGRVEVRHYGIWGTVCDDDFSFKSAKVVCGQLGFGGEAIAKKDGFFGPGEGPIWLDEVMCRGNETQIQDCYHASWGTHNCDHNEDVGVICGDEPLNDPKFPKSAQSDATQPTPKFDMDTILPSDCGRRPEDFGESDDGIFARVVRGSIAPKGSYPWQASLRVRSPVSRSNHWCGGVIISPLHVLTAAHCLHGYKKTNYFIRAGDYHSEIDEGTEFEGDIEDFYVHEEFGKGHRMNNDIALVLLKGRGIPLGEHIMPICLPPADADYTPGLNCTISGFGSTRSGDSLSSLNLRYGWIPLIDREVCSADYIYGRDKISDGMVCAGFLDESVDSCDGDSGGPLACPINGAFTLYGITSWGHHCGELNKPGVYIRIAYYRDWIENKIRESMFGK